MLLSFACQPYLASSIRPAAAAFAAWFAVCAAGSAQPRPAPASGAGPALCNPTDIAVFKGCYVAAEVTKNRLAIFDDLSLSNLRHFDPVSIGKEFHGPHYLSLSPWGSLLISDGWGSSVIEITDLDGSGWKSFDGVDRRFNAPHGVCADTNGWVYVADSLNSRIVRFRDMDGKDWQVFPDPTRKVAYVRELAFAEGALWAANSYENKPGSPPGRGGNVLLIRDFESGPAEEIAAVPESNLTAIMPLGGRRALIGLWGGFEVLALADADTAGIKVMHGSRAELGAPYGMFADPLSDRLLVCCLGSLDDKGAANAGGIAVYEGGRLVPLPLAPVRQGRAPGLAGAP